MVLFLTFCILLGVLSSWMAASWLISGAPFSARASLFAALLVYSQTFWFTYVLTGGKPKFPAPVEFLTSMSAPWLVMSIFIFAVLCLLSLLKIIPNVQSLHRMFGCAALAAIFAAMAFGVWNADRPTVRRYDVALSRAGRELSAVALSDFHFGSGGMTLAKMKKTADIVSSLSPDIILIAGDILDNDTAPLGDAALMREMSRLKAPLGTFAVLGNHDMYSGAPDAIVGRMKELGINVLVDEYADTDGGRIRVAGRRDISFSRGGAKRRPLDKLLAGKRPDALTIVLDHTPQYFSEAQTAGADLQVSGHTHNGQYFPVNLAVKLFYKKPWGVYKKGNSALFTSCGIGTWGAPMRTASVSEIALLRLIPEKQK